MTDFNNSPENTAPDAAPGNVDDLQAAFEKGKENLAGEPQAEIKPRGRPRGSKDSKPRKAARRQPNGKFASTETPELPESPPPPPMPSLKPILVPACKIPFEILARRTGYEGFRVSDTEVEPAAAGFDDALQAVMREYFPQLEGPWAMAAGGVFAMGLLLLSRMPGFLQSRREKVVAASTPPAEQAA